VYNLKSEDTTSLASPLSKFVHISFINPSDSVATVPTTGDMLEALDALCTELSGSLIQISDLSAELAAKDHIGIENIHDVCFYFMRISRHRVNDANHMFNV
jgi:hypothetical protein